MEDVRQQWTDFLNPSVIRTRLVSVGLFMVAHEMLLASIKERLLEFYADDWFENGRAKQSEAYRKKVLPLDPKGKSDALRASIAWLRKMDAVSYADEKSIQEFTDARNQIAHELRNVVSGTRIPHFDTLFPCLVDLIVKIDKWWIMNVSIDTDPMFADREVNPDDIQPGSQILLQVLSQVALGQEEEAWALYNEFIKSCTNLSRSK